jgi:ATP-dependent DNA ligase
MRVEDGEVVLRSRKGLDWTEKFPAIANAAKPFADCIVDGEIVALDHNGAPDFAALQAALSESNTDQLVFFAFDLLFIGREDLRELPLAERKAKLKAMLAKQKKMDAVIRYVDHFETAGDARALQEIGIRARFCYSPARRMPATEAKNTDDLERFHRSEHRERPRRERIQAAGTPRR